MSSAHGASAVRDPPMWARHEGGRRTPLATFATVGGREVLAFDLEMNNVATGVQAVGQALSLAGASRPFILIGFTWYVDDQVAHAVADALDELASALAGEDLRGRILILCTVQDEVERLQALLPGYAIALVHSCYSLSEDELFIEARERIYDCVLNARPAGFKNHPLSASLGAMARISYGEAFQRRAGDFVDLGAVHPGPVFWDVRRDQLRRLLNQSHCGVMLSNIEGCCYSSAEYLACGLPVVSTPSQGGRDAYYDASNAIIVENDPDAVRRAVDGLVARSRAGDLDRPAIRAGFVARQRMFRRALAEALAALTGADADGLHDDLCRTIAEDPRLNAHVNRYVTAVERA